MKRQKRPQSLKAKRGKEAVAQMLQNRVSYGYYFNDYSMGQNPLLDAEQFAVYEARARRFLTGICSCPIPNNKLDDAFACICAVAEELYLQKGGNIKSETIDGYSVTFAEDKGGRQKLINIASLYLGQSGILYAGVE